jgi:hypothetical protein
MVGGHSALAQDERLLRFIFPERPGALMKFLSLMQPSWNISLFHYRNQGADYGKILVGLQVPKVEHKAKVFISIKMVRVLMGIGRMIFSMVLVLKLGAMALFIKVCIH